MQLLDYQTNMTNTEKELVKAIKAYIKLNNSLIEFATDMLKTQTVIVEKFIKASMLLKAAFEMPKEVINVGDSDHNDFVEIDLSGEIGKNETEIL